MNWLPILLLGGVGCGTSEPAPTSAPEAISSGLVASMSLGDNGPFCVRGIMEKDPETSGVLAQLGVKKTGTNPGGSVDIRAENLTKDQLYQLGNSPDVILVWPCDRPQPDWSQQALPIDNATRSRERVEEAEQFRR